MVCDDCCMDCGWVLSQSEVSTPKPLGRPRYDHVWLGTRHVVCELSSARLKLG